MKLIVGLGNPGTEYEKTRHNAGFLLIDRFCDKLGVKLDKNKCKAQYGVARYKGEKIIIAKPQTYMNLSGQAVSSLMHFYDIDVKDLIVCHDDLDLPVGKLRLRRQGSAGGQNGLRHIVQCLGTQKFIRIRVGTGGKPEGWELADWVLSRFTMDDRALVDDAIVRAADAVAAICTDGIDKAMNVYNVKA